MKGLYKYKVTIFEHLTGDESVRNGVVYAEGFGNAVDKIVKNYEYYGDATTEYDTEICDITISPVLDVDGNMDDIYEFEEVK